MPNTTQQVPCHIIGLSWLNYPMLLTKSFLLACLTQRVMWGIVITWCPSLSVEMFIGWSSNKFMFFRCWSEIHKRNKKPKGIRKGVFGAFIFQPSYLDEVFFFIFLIKVSLFTMLTDCLWLLLFPWYKGPKKGPTPKVHFGFFSNRFDRDKRD